MKRLLALALAASLVAAAVAFSGGQKPTGGELDIRVEDRNPWTHLRFNNSASEFRFAIVSDRTGGHRARIFSQAVDRLNLMQPEFVVSVGDLIEGYTKDTKKISAEWKEFQTYVSRLQMPFFYVPGNHDVTNSIMVKDWGERFGRRYYHFVYREVLFLCLDSDDPPDKGGHVSEDQLKYIEKVLKDVPAPRWTVVALHKPLWVMGSTAKNGWGEVERLLSGRKYTVFCGHVHRYQKFVRGGMNYYQLATTGGGSRMRGVRYGEFDHFVWVTMKKEGPVIANVMLDGIYPEDLKPSVTDEEGVVRTNRKPTHPVKGRVFFDGCPAANARVAFYNMEDKKKPAYIGDALVDADGTFVLSTYEANDGAPVGEFAVTVVCREPMWDDNGKAGPNRLPAQYATPEQTPLRARVVAGPNEFTFSLRK